MNGDGELRLPLPPSSTLQELRTAAQQAFGKKHLRLITAKNRVLVDFEQTLEEAEIKDGECLTVLVLQPQLAATSRAFALWCGDNAVVTWGPLAATVRQFKASSGVSSRFKPHLGPLLRFSKMDPSWPGVMQILAVTVRQFEISSGVCSTFKPQFRPLLRFWQMDLSLPGVLQTMAVTVRQFQISSGVSSRFKPHLGPLLRFWKMDPSWPGVMQTSAVTVR